MNGTWRDYAFKDVENQVGYKLAGHWYDRFKQLWREGRSTQSITRTIQREMLERAKRDGVT